VRKANDHTPRKCPFKVCLSLPSSKFHIFMVRSKLPVAMMFFSTAIHNTLFDKKHDEKLLDIENFSRIKSFIKIGR
jgi:hypothetical protein